MLPLNATIFCMVAVYSRGNFCFSKRPVDRIIARCSTLSYDGMQIDVIKTTGSMETSNSTCVCAVKGLSRLHLTTVLVAKMPANTTSNMAVEDDDGASALSDSQTANLSDLPDQADESENAQSWVYNQNSLRSHQCWVRFQRCYTRK